jgi:hypothetical protein
LGGDKIRYVPPNKTAQVRSREVDDIYLIGELSND